APRGPAQRRPDPAGRGRSPRYRTALVVAAQPAGALPQDRAGQLAAPDHPRRPQPPGASDDRRGRPADVAPRAGAWRGLDARRPRPGRVALSRLNAWNNEERSGRHDCHRDASSSPDILAHAGDDLTCTMPACVASPCHAQWHSPTPGLEECVLKRQNRLWWHWTVEEWPCARPVGVRSNLPRRSLTSVDGSLIGV